MTDKIRRIFVLIFIICALLVGLLSIYRATLRASDLNIINGKVIDKKIEYFTSFRSGRHYCLTFQLANRQDKIAINLGTKSQAEKDSAFYLIDTGKTYKFYLDPTVPTKNSENWGIDRIDYNGIQVYKTSNKLNLYGGTFISVLSLVGIFILFKHKRKENGS
jgi:hypothetical protein